MSDDIYAPWRRLGVAIAQSAVLDVAAFILRGALAGPWSAAGYASFGSLAAFALGQGVAQLFVVTAHPSLKTPSSLSCASRALKGWTYLAVPTATSVIAYLDVDGFTRAELAVAILVGGAAAVLAFHWLRTVRRDTLKRASATSHPG